MAAPPQRARQEEGAYGIAALDESGRGGATRDAALVLEASGLRKSYGSRVALSAVSLDAHAGELVACIGPNGAGKTTLLTILADIKEPDAGVVRRLRAPIGWVPQQPALYGKLSAAENLRLFARLDGVDDVEGAVTRMLAQAGLEGRADEPVERLSGGNRQRVNIAIGLLSAPAVLLLDEPSSGLDPRQRERLWTFIGELAAAGTTVVYATHNVSEAEQYADRVLVLADGERLFWGPPEELRRAVASGRPEPGPVDFEAAFVAFLHERGH
jgi:ABC-2 type transport system ATP-binding protein